MVLAMDRINAVVCKPIQPYGHQLHKKVPWFPQELSNEWPHEASALSFGESSIIKHGLSYPRRSGVDAPEDADFPQFCKYFPRDKYGLTYEVDEYLVYRGVCIVSTGPVGGPSQLKGVYRPLPSYGTGIGIRDATHVKFPPFQCIKPDGTAREMDPEEYVCLSEKSGISFHRHGSSDSHVVYFPEFEIERIFTCGLGLLVVPKVLNVPGRDNEDSERRIYILTDPLKQGSRIWQKNMPGQDYTEYNSCNEKLVGVDDDVCIFWSLNHDHIILRRLVKLDPSEQLQMSVLNTSTYQFHMTQFMSSEYNSGSFGPNGKHTPFRRPSSPSGFKVNKEGSNVYYWPSFDNSNSHDASINNGLAHGFYPPHVCVYDNPEVFFRTLFHIDLLPGKWTVPQKFRTTRSTDGKRMALFSHIRNRIYVHGLDILSAKKLCHYCIKDVKDFSVSENGGITIMVLVTKARSLKIAWLDADFSLSCSTFISLGCELDGNIRGISKILNGDTFVAETDKRKKYVVRLRNWRKNNLVRKCVESFMESVNHRIATWVVCRYMEHPQKPSVVPSTLFDSEWEEFVEDVDDVISNEAMNTRAATAGKVIQALDKLKDTLKIHQSSHLLAQKLDMLKDCMTKLLNPKLSKKLLSSRGDLENASCFQRFATVLMADDPESEPSYDSLPEILQLLAGNVNDLSALESIVSVCNREPSYAPAIEILIADLLVQNQARAKFSWPVDVLKAVRRHDLLCGRKVDHESHTIDNPGSAKDTIAGNETTWMHGVLQMGIFSRDRRLEEACKMLDSSKPAIVEVEQRAEMSDHEFVEEQEKALLQQIQVTFSAPVGRAAFTLRTEDKNFANLTSHINVPKLCISGKCATKNTNIDLSESDLPATTLQWPNFHNAVASALSVRFNDSPADAWFGYNKIKTTEGPEQAGMILGFGLNGILSYMPPTLRHDYVAKENSFITMAMLLGLSANQMGSGDISTWKLISLHISAMLPACSTELEIPRFAALVAPVCLGLLFMNSRNSHIAKVLLGEISKRYNPLSNFSNLNSSASNVNYPDMSVITPDREAHTLCAGFGLGFVNLGKGKFDDGGVDDGVDGVLRRFVVGGPKPAHPHLDEEDLFSQYGQNMPSLWEDYRCCHIQEGDNVNVDVTTPSAVVAVALIYLRSGNDAVLNWLAPPNTLHLLDGVRPDLLMLRSLASVLVFESIPIPDVAWLESVLLPDSLKKNALQLPDEFGQMDHESINQAWASVVCGYCLGLGIRYAGTSEQQVIRTLWHYTDLFVKISDPESKVGKYFPKNFLESSTCTLVLALALVKAGTGSVKVLRLCRYLQAKIATSVVVSSNSNTYGFEMCISMATGILFLGGGRYSLSNDDRSVAVLLASMFPKWPVKAHDNRYHIQALRHLYVLAAQPRLILPKPMPQNEPINFVLEFQDGSQTEVAAPVLLPPFYMLKKVSLKSKSYLPIEFSLPEDEIYLNEIVKRGGTLVLAEKPYISQDVGLMRQMGWRQQHVFHPTFKATDDIPNEESAVVERFNLFSRLCTWHGIPTAAPEFLQLYNGNVENPDWVWQLRTLFWWKLKVESRKETSCISKDLLGMLLAKGEGKVKVFETDAGSPKSQAHSGYTTRSTHRLEAST